MSTQNLFQKEAIEKLKELSEKARTCMFVTELDQLPSNSRPMSLQECDDEGNLWFIPNSAIEKKEYFSILISNCVAVEKNKR